MLVPQQTVGSAVILLRILACSILAAAKLVRNARFNSSLSQVVMIRAETF
tara:strand:- start:3620 stop:3769 length:150 start_codon:yes stop_codon:yes gene_type:complete